MKWCTQAIDAIRYIHEKGVIHSNLRPENYLLYTDISGILNLYLSDFGGSIYGDIDSRHLPDSGFFNPYKPWVLIEDTDIFSLGSVFYIIMTGHWPYKSPGLFELVEDKWRYEAKVDELFSQGKFPIVEGLASGGIIHSYWTG
jgi:serine/threonine protein kinase